jgi:hypothetical protein
VAWTKTDNPGYVFLLFAVAVALVVLAMLAFAAYLN